MEGAEIGCIEGRANASSPSGWGIKSQMRQGSCRTSCNWKAIDCGAGREGQWKQRVNDKADSSIGKKG